MRLSDDDLMAMFASGTGEAFDMLYDRYRHRIYGFALTCLHSEADAEDLVQDVFLRIARSAEHYEPRNRFKAWIFSIAANRIRALAAREGLLREKTLEMHRMRAGGSFRPDASPTDRAVAARDILERFLGRLTPEQRMLLLLKEVEGMDGATIAETMGLSPSNVRVKIHRLRVMLRHLFREHPEKENTDG
ncbi:MAG TPA: RNA polymerase sigma factor [bacterium]|nr:RNA polymerase sigma factor [bacterium]